MDSFKDPTTSPSTTTTNKAHSTKRGHKIWPLPKQKARTSTHTKWVNKVLLTTQGYHQDEWLMWLPKVEKHEPYQPTSNTPPNQETRPCQQLCPHMNQKKERKNVWVPKNSLPSSHGSKMFNANPSSYPQQQIRKWSGCKRKTISFSYFLWECTLNFEDAMILSLVYAKLIVPSYSTLIQKQ